MTALQIFRFLGAMDWNITFLDSRKHKNGFKYMDNFI